MELYIFFYFSDSAMACAVCVLLFFFFKDMFCILLTVYKNIPIVNLCNIHIYFIDYY